MNDTQQPEALEAEIKAAFSSAARTWRMHHHILLITTEVVLIGFVAVLVGLGALVWRLQQSPVEAIKLEKPLEDFIAAASGVDEADITRPTLTYDKAKHAVVIKTQSLQLYRSSGPIAAMQDVTLALSMPDLLLLKLRLPFVTIGEMGVRVARLSNNTLGLTATTQKAQSFNPIALANFLSKIDTAVLQKGTLTLETTTNEAPVVYPDISVTFKASSQKQKAGSIALKFSQKIDALGADALGLAYNVLPDQSLVNVAAYLPGADLEPLLEKWGDSSTLPIVKLRVAGQAQVALDTHAALRDLKFDLQSGEGSFAWPAQDVSEQAIRRVVIKGGYNARTGEVLIEPSGFMLKGVELFAAAKLNFDRSFSKGEGTIVVSSPVVAVPMLKLLWPAKFDSGAREWLAERMLKGRFAGIKATLPLTVQKTKTGWATHIKENVEASFRFADITLRYHHALQDVAGVTGTGTYKGKALDLVVSSAHVDSLKVRSGTFQIDDLITPNTGTATLALKVDGPVARLAKFLSVDPVDLHKRTDLKLQQASGTGAYDARVVFPITHDAKAEDVVVEARAVLRNVNIPDVVRGLPLTGGPFTLVLDPNKLTFNGKGRLGGQPATLGLWHDLKLAGAGSDPAMVLKGKLTTNDSGRKAFIGKVAEQVSGPLVADINYTNYKSGLGKLVGTLSADAARIDFSPINFVKQAGVATNGSFKGQLKNGVLQTLSDMQLTGGIGLQNGSMRFGANESTFTANFPSVKLGTTQGSLVYDSAPASEKIAFKGSVFDARYLKQQKGKAAAKTVRDIAIEAGTIYLSETPLTGGRLVYTENASGQVTRMDINGKVAGAPLSVQYTLGRSFNFNAADAGTALSMLGITDRVRGGTMRLSATPSGGNEVTGTMQLDKFSVRNAPALAKLINLLSLPGLLNILANDTGLSFSRLESKFVWQNQPGKSLYQFRDGRTSGSSLGLTFEGEVNETSGNMAVQGTVIPMSEVNGLLSSIPVIGDILTGGNKGSGIFAATYTMKGPVADPSVMVNPLSVLAPGLIRRILFEGSAPKAKGKE